MTAVVNGTLVLASAFDGASAIVVIVVTIPTTPTSATTASGPCYHHHINYFNHHRCYPYTDDHIAAAILPIK